MSRFRRFDIVESPYYLKQSCIFDPPRMLLLNPLFSSFSAVEDELDYTLDLLHIAPTPSLFQNSDIFTDLARASTRRLIHLQTLNDRVSALQLGFGRLMSEEKTELGNRKYSWTAEIKSDDGDRKYKWTAEKKGSEKSYKLTAEIKRKGPRSSPIEQRYTVKVSSGDSCSESVDKKKKKKSEKEKGKSSTKVVEIQEPFDHGTLVLRQAFAKRVDKRRGKKKELSLQDAATLIQKSFRAYLIRRSQALRALRELAIAKTKLKDIRALFNNFSYRRRLTRDAEEHQRFSEKIIVLLLTVDAIEGADIMVRAAKRSMVNELEAMVDVVDPQPQQPGKSLSMRRRMFDMPDSTINKELIAGVAEVVQMLDQEETTGFEAFEACL